MRRPLIMVCVAGALASAGGCRSGTLDPQTGTGASGMVSGGGAAGGGGVTGSSGAAGGGGAVNGSGLAGVDGAGGAVSIGGFGGSASGTPTGSGGAGVASPLGPGCVDCLMSSVNAPTWQPVDAVIFAAGIAVDDDYLPTVETILAPNHVRDTALRVFGPGHRHLPPYDGELFQLALLQKYQPQQQYVLPTLLSPSSSLVFMITLAARPDGPSGRSADFELGPVIPNVRFPMRVQAHMRVGAQLLEHSILDPIFDATIPGYDAFSPPISGDGPSHFVLAFRTNSGFATDRAIGAGSYYLDVAITDATGAAWDILLRFQLDQLETP